MSAESPRRRWARAYARLRRAEGRGAGGEAELLALPYLFSGPLAGQWAIRGRTFDALKTRVVVPLAKERARGLAVLDLGAGNGWLCARLARDGHRCVALDLRVDDVDGLATGAAFRRHLASMFGRVCASFDALPFSDALFDLVVFDASPSISGTRWPRRRAPRRRADAWLYSTLLSTRVPRQGRPWPRRSGAKPPGPSVTSRGISSP
jgi:SAM-dependent methyltransferase